MQKGYRLQVGYRFESKPVTAGSLDFTGFVRCRLQVTGFFLILECLGL